MCSANMRSTAARMRRRATAEVRCPATAKMRRARAVTAAAADSVRSRATTAASARCRDSAACPTATGYGNDGKDFDLCHGTLERPRDVFPDERAQPGSNQPSTVAKVPLAMVGNPRPLRELGSPKFPTFGTSSCLRIVMTPS